MSCTPSAEVLLNPPPINVILKKEAMSGYLKVSSSNYWKKKRDHRSGHAVIRATVIGFIYADERC